MKLTTFSKSQPRNPKVDGTPAQVYAFSDPDGLVKTVTAGNAASVRSCDVDGNIIAAYFPHIDKDLLGKPVAIVGNASDVKGECSIVVIPLSNATHFVTLGKEDRVPEYGRGPSPIPIKYLVGSPWEGQEDIYSSLMPIYIPFYFEDKDTEEPADTSLFSQEMAEHLAEQGYGYTVWLHLAQNARGNDAAAALAVVDAIKEGGDLELYVKSGLEIAPNGCVANLTQGRSTDYPAISASIKGFFCPPVGVPPAPSGAVGGVGEGSIINVRTATDIQLDTTAQLGLARVKLYFMGGEIDVEAGTITNPTYPIFSDSFIAVLALPRAARQAALASLIEDGFATARAGSHSSLMSRYFDSFEFGSRVCFAICKNWQHSFCFFAL